MAMGSSSSEDKYSKMMKNAENLEKKTFKKLELEQSNLNLGMPKPVSQGDSNKQEVTWAKALEDKK